MARRDETAVWLAVAALVAGCATGATTRCDVTKCSDDLLDTSHTVTYADGSGNAYVLSGARLEYRPVEPETSSSGTYSGGKPFSRTLTAGQRADLARAVNAAIDARGAHVLQRVMMSGQIGIECPGQTHLWILAPGSAELRGIEVVLRRLQGEAPGSKP